MQHTPTNHYIDGHWISGSGASFTSVNPADGTTIWQGRMAVEEEVHAAIASANKALPHWARLDPATRANHLDAFAKIIKEKQKELAFIIAEESGKPLWEATTEVNAVIAKIKFSIKAYEERTSEKQQALTDATGYVRYKPHGVIAVIGPFNFPAHLSNGHIVPALLAGNTVVYKPSELTPKVAEFILQSWHESGLPEGVINGIQGDASSATLLLNQDIQGVFFTGSYRTGLHIHQHFSHRPEVIVALEMGGNNPLIIDKVRDLNAAVYHTLVSSFITAGQRCSCARRLFIPDNAMGDAFLNTFIQATDALSIGPFTNTPEPFMGPVISHAHALHHLKAQRALIDAGGRALLSMSSLAENTGLLSPGIIDMSAVTHAVDEEIFAPLVQLYRYRHFEEALDRANQTRYGLSAALMSDDLNHYEQFYERIHAGLINWNRPTTGAASELPFGGVGRSGNHRPSAYFAADYCAYPIASLEQPMLAMPTQPLPGIRLT